MSKWVFEGEPLMEPPEGAYGFVYLVETIHGFYIGQKSFYSITNPKISKKRSEELYSGRGRKPTKEKKIKESNWRTYKTSHKGISSLPDKDILNWEIVEFASTKSDLLYKETRYIICNNCLVDPQCLNDWVSCKIRKNNLKDVL